MNTQDLPTSDTLSAIENWHSLACPRPDDDALRIQFACHLEEIVEMLDEILILGHDGEDIGIDLAYETAKVTDLLKQKQATIKIINREGFLDALADQIVTAVGTGYRAGMKVPAAAYRVNISNWSKFVYGLPQFDENGKITKGPNYQKVELKGLF